MAQRLTKRMKETLRIMAEGHEIEWWRAATGKRYWVKGDKRYWDYIPRPRSYARPLESTVRALQRRKLIREEPPFERDWPTNVIARFPLTEAGRRAAAEVANA